MALSLSCRLLLLLALATFSTFQHISAFGVQDFKDLEQFPVNTYKSRAAFYLDSNCDPFACQNSCTGLNLGGGQCSRLPDLCLCNAQTELHSKVVELNAGSKTRVYQFANDWTIYPELKCGISGGSPSNEVCDRSCRPHTFGHGNGICLKFTAEYTTEAVCACKASHRRPSMDSERETLITAPFATHQRKQSIAVKNMSSSVYLSSNLCIRKDCETTCAQFKLANGICDDYFSMPACRCDTGMNETRVATDLQIKAYAGGIYTLNGWHLFEHDPQDQCDGKICAAVCHFWGSLATEFACFEGNGITSSCACREYPSNAPSESELEEARNYFSFATSLLPNNLVAVLILTVINLCGSAYIMDHGISTSNFCNIASPIFI